MPVYMDRHIVPGITLADATKAHNLDVAIQDEYDCKTLTFWVDEERGSAFCLVEAPSEQAVRDLHENAHGLMPHEIMEVEEDVVMAFLGRVSDPEPENGDTATDIFYEPAYRSVMLTKLKEAALIPSKYGKKKGQGLFKIHNQVIEQALNRFDGREVRQTGDGFMASFASVSKSVNCAIEIQNQLKKYHRASSEPIIDVAIGLSAGDPVTGTDDLFGEAIQLAQRLCYLSTIRGEIMISSLVNERYGGNRLGMLSETNAVTSLNTTEENFLNRLMNIIESKWNRKKLRVSDVCKKIGQSRAQLYRNLTSLTGHSFVDFVNEYRLKQALLLIEKYPENIARVAYETGFNNPSYFAKRFKEQFDVLPSEYAKTVG